MVHLGPRDPEKDRKDKPRRSDGGSTGDEECDVNAMCSVCTNSSMGERWGDELNNIRAAHSTSTMNQQLS